MPPVSNVQPAHKQLACIRTCRWEYEKGTSAEAQLCKDFDKLEMIIQASEYEQAQAVQLQEFFDSTAGKWNTSIGCVPGPPCACS
jgi:HD domain